MQKMVVNRHLPQQETNINSFHYNQNSFPSDRLKRLLVKLKIVSWVAVSWKIAQLI